MAKIPIPGRYRTLARDIAAMACPMFQNVRPYVALVQAGQAEQAHKDYPLMQAHLQTCAECQSLYQQLQPAAPAPATTQVQQKRRRARA